jgi:hypothetical protein
MTVDEKIAAIAIEAPAARKCHKTAQRISV